jgi:protein O-mannosyl-transferase
MISHSSGKQAIWTNIMRSNVFIVLFLFFLTAIVYTSAINNEFTNWDDNNYITANRHIADFSWEGLKYLLTERTGLGGTRLTLVNFMIDYKFWALNPVPYHIENILWHILNTLLVFFLFIKLNINRRIAFIVAVLFAVHPMHVESVAWISERKDVLYTFFLLLCLHTYIYYIRAVKSGPRIASWLIFTLFFYLSWHSKFSAVIIPFLLFLIDYYLKRRFTWHIILEKLPILLFIGWEVHRMAFDMTPAVHVHGKISVSNSHPTDSFNLFDKMQLASYSLLFYLMKFLLPVNLTAIVPYPAKIKGCLPDIYFQSLIIATIICILVLFFVIRFRKTNRQYIFGFLFFLISLAPFLHFVSIKGIVVVADRYTYVPYIGLSFLIAVILDLIILNKNKFVGWGIFSMVVIILSLTSFQRNKVWNNNISLFTDVIDKNPKVVQAYNNRGNAYNDLGEYKLALADFNKAIILSPTFKFLYNNRSYTWSEMDCTRLAYNDLDKAIQLDSFYIDPYLNKAKLLIKDKRVDEAIDNYSKALKIAPKRASTYILRARAFILINKKDSVLNDYTKAIEFFPNNLDAHFERGRIYSIYKQYTLALSDFQTVIAIDPSVPEIYNEIGDVLNNTGKYEEAYLKLNRAIELRPEYAEAYSNRGISNFGLKKPNEALSDFNKALEIDSVFSKAYSNRGNYWAVQRNFDAALIDFNHAIKLNSNDYLTYVNRGNVYFQLNRKDLACDDWHKAANLNFKPASEAIKKYCK